MREDFRTVRGYDILDRDRKPITQSMEDYLEMIYRLRGKTGEWPKTGDLARALNVKPPSATNMARRLSERGFLSYHPYGTVALTGRGEELGKYLLWRHNTVLRFLKFIGVRENLQEDAERIEHNLSRESVERLAQFLKGIADD